MRKFFFIASVLAIAASCTVSEPESATIKAPSFFAFAEGNDPAAKTSISVDAEGVGTIWWKPAEKINVFFGATSVPYTSTNTEDATTVVFETTAFIGSTEGSSNNKWGLYPYDANATCNGSSVTTTIPSTQSCVAETFGTNLFPMVAQTSDNELHFLNVCGGIKFSLSREDIESITFKGNNDEDIAGKVQITLGSDGKPASTVVPGEKTITMTPDSGSTFSKNKNYYIVMLPTVLSNGFTMTFETASQIGTFNYTTKSVEIKRSNFGKKADIDTYATFVEKEPEVVDLGLSVNWATCNLGASKPEEYGGYYQWAGTTDVTNKSISLDWSNCPYHKGTSSSTTGWTKYVPADKSSFWSGSNNPDNKTVLDPEDDIAHVKLGGNWRMPTIEEWDELKNTSNCSWTWTSINGINGYKVQSKVAGFTDNWIFLPAAGHRSSGSLSDVGSYGYYWSSSLDTGNPNGACFLRFYSGDVYTHNHYRYSGLSVRPVSE